MRKILRHGFRENCLFIIILIAVILFLLTRFALIEASLRSSNLNELMEKSLLRFRKVEVNDIVFDVYINQKDKSIKVQGEVEDWEEKNKIEKYFRMRAPSDFHIIYDICIIY